MNSAQTAGRWTRLGAAALVGLLGLTLAMGGTLLVADGGSLYYLAAGLALITTALLLWRDDRRARLLYVVMFAVTLIWSLWEVGFAGWPLVPRLLAPAGLGLLLLVIPLDTSALTSAHRIRRVSATIALFALSVAAGFLLHRTTDADPVPAWLRRGTQTAAPGWLAKPLAVADRSDWSAFGNDQGGTRFSPLTQIAPGNVAELKVAWTVDAGPAGPGPKNGLETVPIMIGDTLYACSGYNRILAYDAETGQTRWTHDMAPGREALGKPCRGVSYYRVPGATGLCAERIFGASQVPTLVAVDARTGRPCPGFGTAGAIELNANISRYPKGQFYVSSAPQIVRGKVVVGGGIPDNQFWHGPSGVIRAYDAVTGTLAWAYDPGHPDRIGAPPAGQTYTPSSPNSWAPISADETLGLVYLPMGGATPDNYGAQRRPSDEALGDAVIALDAETGRLRWRFQTTHHDIWDYDVPAQPTLADLPTPNGIRQGLIQATKRGEVFVLDRTTGRPIFPVVEMAVPQNRVTPGERLTSTQPFSTGLPAFRGGAFREKDMWGATPIDQMLCRIQFRRSRYEGHLTPSMLDKPTIFDPGSSGGVNWGGVSLDVDHGIMVVTWMRTADRVTVVSRQEATKRDFKLNNGKTPGGDAQRPMLNTPFGAYGTPFLSPLGVPCTTPPWGFIGAVDLTTGKLIWSKPLGSARDTGPLGIPSMLPITIGTPLTGGSITTRSGLVFVGAAAENTLRALDVRTGRELWQARLPGGANATPITYISPRSGRQFVVIAAGGNKALKTTLANKIVAFALPRT
ncbi:pyrroloquinoline quinone-dependent dehydrogenase [Sphingomonas sp. AP4-R1]|uniref:pyrroloquinoline quinone-dependent dehydrogenase n=1 Tax=Sphingomonas sp. AP4-R1 TaxID=2735134 RepID=UPI0014935414|nr:pyrroloquinoline quinone-dependent dehydrogenase [Sphingomonas sp. AP4-R1]QJU58226.1 pyrroloquinoline quinone-dependent dehydrogenase [Sphingomonas sp. AP4-R1]